VPVDTSACGGSTNTGDWWRKTEIRTGSIFTTVVAAAMEWWCAQDHFVTCTSSALKFPDGYALQVINKVLNVTQFATAPDSVSQYYGATLMIRGETVDNSISAQTWFNTTAMGSPTGGLFHWAAQYLALVNPPNVNRGSYGSDRDYVTGVAVGTSLWSTAHQWGPVLAWAKCRGLPNATAAYNAWLTAVGTSRMQGEAAWYWDAWASC
jgi:hypothetical protein